MGKGGSEGIFYTACRMYVRVTNIAAFGGHFVIRCIHFVEAFRGILGVILGAFWITSSLYIDGSVESQFVRGHYEVVLEVLPESE